MKIIDNKWYRWYIALIESRRLRPDPIHYENHHIVPSSLGGTNDASNIIKLTPREHYIAHILLTKFTYGQERSKMCYALNFMTSTSTGRSRAYQDHRIYAWKHIDRSVELIEQIASKNRGKKRTEEAKRKISVSQKGIPKTEQHRINAAIAKKGKHHKVPRAPEHKAKLSAAQKGKPRRPLTEQEKENQRRVQLNTPRNFVFRICPHCSKSGSGGGMIRWHFDNCKSFDSIQIN